MPARSGHPDTSTDARPAVRRAEDASNTRQSCVSVRWSCTEGGGVRWSGDVVPVAFPVALPMSSGLPAESRRLPVIGFIALVVLYLVIVQGLGLLLTRGLDTKYAAPTSVNELWRSITVPVGLSVVLVAARDLVAALVASGGSRRQARPALARHRARPHARLRPHRDELRRVG